MAPFSRKSTHDSNQFQPFIQRFELSIEALHNMSATLDNELKSLVSYYGEDPNSTEAPKPEDFFGLVASFSSSLQVSPPTRTPILHDNLFLEMCP